MERNVNCNSRSITYFSNCLNHHLIGICDELYNQIDEGFRFVITKEQDASNLKGGVDYSSCRNYCIKAYEGGLEREKAKKLAKDSEVCIFGFGSLEYVKIRARENPKGLSFEGGERWLKRGIINLLSPTLLKWLYTYMAYSRKANFYYLCASGYSSKDLRKMCAYENRCFKWGYFTKVDNNFEVEAAIQGASTSEITLLMWCARFLKLKHPELPVLLAAKLKSDGYKFRIDMFGSGEELDNTRKLINELKVGDYVSLRGSKPNSEILQEMKKHSIFLFTSDKKEGWGAVANEAMANGCALVACKEIGSVPYLVDEGETGYTFASNDLKELYEKVKYLLDRPQKLEEIRHKGNLKMKQQWNPQKAASAFLKLTDDLMSGRPCSICSGPCSKA